MVSDYSPVLIGLRSKNCEQFQIANPYWTSKWCEDVSSSMKRSMKHLHRVDEKLNFESWERQSKFDLIFLHRTKAPFSEHCGGGLHPSSRCSNIKTRAPKNLRRIEPCWGYLRTSDARKRQILITRCHNVRIESNLLTWKELGHPVLSLAFQDTAKRLLLQWKNFTHHGERYAQMIWLKSEESLILKFKLTKLKA